MAGRRRSEPGNGKGREQDGQALAEYTFIVMLIALVCIGALTLLGIPLQSFFTGFAGSI